MHNPHKILWDLPKSSINITLLVNKLAVESFKSSCSVIIVLYIYVKQIIKKKEKAACISFPLKCHL